MRLISFILMLCLVIPPAPAVACDTAVGAQGGVESGHVEHESVPDAKGDLLSGPLSVDHSIDRHAAHGKGDAAAQPAGHACCDGETPPESCQTAWHCATGTAAPAIVALAEPAVHAMHARLEIRRAGDVLPPSHSSPPYRPPSA